MHGGKIFVNYKENLDLVVPSNDLCIEEAGANGDYLLSSYPGLQSECFSFLFLSLSLQICKYSFAVGIYTRGSEHTHI